MLAMPGMPLPAMFAVIFALGLAGSVGGGVRYGLLGEILPPDGYLLGRSVLNISVGAMQIAGFALGGMLHRGGVAAHHAGHRRGAGLRVGR